MTERITKMHIHFFQLLISALVCHSLSLSSLVIILFNLLSLTNKDFSVENFLIQWLTDKIKIARK